MRGLVISPEYKTYENGAFSISSFIHPNKLRQYVLYWDKLDLPNNNIMYTEGDPEIQYLMDVGVLQRSMFYYTSGSLDSSNVAEFYSKMQFEAYVNNNKEKREWSLAQPNKELVLSKEVSEQTSTVEVHLYDSLPVPSPDTSLDDILHFKERREDELLEFRALMDGFYLELIKHGDSERAMELYIGNIQRKIIDIDKVMNESMMSRLRASTKIRFDLGDVIKNTIFGGIGGATIFNSPSAIGVGATLGLATSCIKITTEKSLKPKGIPHELRDYAYLYYAEKELN